MVRILTKFKVWANLTVALILRTQVLMKAHKKGERTTDLKFTCIQIMAATLTLEFCTLAPSLADPSPSLKSESEDVTLIEDSLSEIYWEHLALLCFTFEKSFLRKCGGLYTLPSDLSGRSLCALGLILLRSFFSRPIGKAFFSRPIGKEELGVVPESP